MTIFGKIVMGTLLLVVVGGVFYGVTSYVNKDTASTSLPVVATTTTPVVEVTIATTTASTTASTTPEKPASKKIPFIEFMKQSGAYKCTVTQTVATMTTNGTVYLDNGKVKADFAMSIAGQSINTSMIIRDGYSYTWTSNSPTK
jgi:predicted membrane-bound mannosyltransferase